MLVDKLKARDLMTRCVQTVRTDSSLTEALAIMDANEFGQLPVMEGTKPVALLREADLRRALLEHRQDRPVGELASSLPHMVSPETRLSAVLQALEQQDTVLAVSPRGRLRGIITYWDVLVLARPYLLVTEIELLLRQAVAGAYEGAFGPDWWEHVPEDTRQKAEEEHRHDDEEEPTATHMLGHTSFYTLIQTLKHAWPEIPPDKLDLLHKVRILRNRVAHHYRMTKAEQRELIVRCAAARDWLQPLL